MIWFLVGLLVGAIIGCIWAIANNTQIDFAEIDDTILYLDGKYYRLVPIDEGEEKKND